MNVHWFHKDVGPRDQAAGRLPAGIIALVVLALHVAVNATARRILESSTVGLLPGVSLRVVENQAGPFGFGPSWASLLAGAAVLGAFVLSRARVSSLALGLILGGGIANLAERLLTGHTTDVVVLANTTALNTADAMIFLGLVFLLWPRRPAGRVAHACHPE